MKRKQRINNTICYIVLILMSIIWLFPFFGLVLQSFRSYATENGESGLLEGVKAVQSKLVGVLEKSGVEVIDPAGEPFDALEAQAVATVPDDVEFDETVRDVYQKGYKMGKKVIRAAMVTITTGGPKRPKDEEADDKE